MNSSDFAPVTELPCPACGKPVHLAAAEDARLCGYCGAKVARPAGPQSLPTTRPADGGGTS